MIEHKYHFELIPVDNGPIQAIREIVGNAFEGRSVEKSVKKRESRQKFRKEIPNGENAVEDYNE